MAILRAGIFGSQVHLRIAEPLALPERLRVYCGMIAGGPSPEEPERFIECLEVLMPVDEQCPQREIEIGSASDINVAEGGSYLRHTPGMHVQASGMK